MRLSVERLHFTKLCEHFLQSLNPAPENVVVCLDCIHRVPESYLPADRDRYRDLAYNFVMGSFYERFRPNPSELDSYVKKFKEKHNVRIFTG